MDYAATSPMSEEVLSSYVEVAKKIYGNSASLHDAGGQANYYIEQARKVVANKLGVPSDGIIFTGSGTEGNIISILSLAFSSKKGKHLITTQAEHTSVHAAMNTAQNAGYEITKLPLHRTGIVQIEAIRAAIRPDTAVISIQHVNSEIGSIQPMLEIAKLAKEHNIFLHVDCVQSFCKLSIEAFSSYVDALTVSAHKISGPKGCGAIYINPKLLVSSLTPGVTHERGVRGGTLDTPSIIAFATAIENYTYNSAYYSKLRQHFKKQLPTNCTLVECANQFPSICGLVIEGMEGQYVLLKLNEVGIYISTGSACDIHSEPGTKAVMAMGYSSDQARCFFRISFGPSTTEEQINHLVAILQKI